MTVPAFMALREGERPLPALQAALRAEGIMDAYATESVDYGTGAPRIRVVIHAQGYALIAHFDTVDKDAIAWMVKNFADVQRGSAQV